MYPLKNKRIPPSKWPTIIAVRPLKKPKEANDVPVFISAIERAAPNQINPWLNKDDFRNQVWHFW